MGKNCIIKGFFYVAKWIFNEREIFTKWIYVKLAIAFFSLLIIKEQIRKMTYFI